MTQTFKFILSVNQTLASLMIFLLKDYKFGKQTLIHKVVNYYRAVTYMCAHFTKQEDETSSEAMKQAAK